MKIQIDKENKYHEICTKLTKRQKINYGLDEDAECSECCFKDDCDKGEFVSEKVDEKTLYNKALEQWGIEAQEGMLIEEIGEVLIAFNKRNRNLNGCSFADYIEELVDLQIMIGQMEVALGDQFREIKKKKLQRLHKRLQEGSQ